MPPLVEQAGRQRNVIWQVTIAVMPASLIQPSRLTCVEVRQPLPGGTSRPLLAAAVDDRGHTRRIVLKLRHPLVDSGHPHFGGTSLACELICAVIARAVGLSVPDYFIVELAPGLAQAMPHRNLQDLLQRNAGEHFGSLFLEGIAEGPPGRGAPITAREMLEDVLSFDGTVINGDRSAAKPNLLRQGDRLFVIDHALALPVHRWSEPQIDGSPLLPEEKVRDHCSFVVLAGDGRTYRRLLSRWSSEMTELEWAQLRGMIPASWEQHPGDLDRIFRFLQNRGRRSAAISADLMRVTR